MEQFLTGLNDEQRAAVLATGNVLITACPGSGKTKVLSHKLAYELSKIEGKKKLVALTYTNRAADELYKRTQLFDVKGARLWTGTIHSFCMEWILKPYQGYCSEIVQGYEIIDEWDSERAVDELKKKHGIPFFEFVKKGYRATGEFDLNKTNHLELVREYKDLLRHKKLLDFEDILYYAYKLLIDYPEIPKRLSKLFQLICVDEYQDTQELQYAILSEIVRSCANETRMFFVGDVSQAIYGSLGGIAKTCEQIEKQFGGISVDTFELLGNYRSTQRIIDYYSNYQLTGFSIKSHAAYAGYQGKLTFNTAVHRDEIHLTVAHLVQHYIKQGISPHEICVLAPQWRFVIPMGRKLKSELPDVDFDAFGLSPFRKVRENIGYKIIRIFLSQPGNHSRVELYKWVSELLLDIDEHVPNFLSDVENRQRFILRLIRMFQSDLRETNAFLVAALEYFFNATATRLANFPELRARIENFIDVTRKELELESFDYATEVELLKRVFSANKGVVVNTCHGVKGEEFTVVIAFGLLHGYVPNWGDTDADSSKKLLYVICSRAKKYLHLISEKGHKTKNNRPYEPTSNLSKTRFSYDEDEPV